MKLISTGENFDELSLGNVWTVQTNNRLVQMENGHQIKLLELWYLARFTSNIANGKVEPYI